MEGGVNGVDKHRRNRATGQLRLFGTLCFFFLKLFKILVECVAPAQVYLVLRNYEPQ